MKQKQNNGHRDQSCGCQGEEVGRGVEWKIDNRQKLLYIEWINNSVLLYSTGNYICYPMINHNEKKYFKKHVYGVPIVAQ